MYSRIEQRVIQGERGAAIALLLELRDAEVRARCTCDLSYKEFLPENWWPRLESLLQSEGF